jgi:hypothetical protein
LTSVAVMDTEGAFDEVTENSVNRALRFCERLIAQRIRYDMDIVRDGAVMVTVAVPGQRWEVDFMSDGTVELERFESAGVETVDDPFARLVAAMGD